MATIFTGLYPRVLVSHPTFANSLTISNAAAGHYALKFITIVAAIFVPLLLLYQSWTYYVFRKRLGGEQVAAPGAFLRGDSVRPPVRSRARPGPVPTTTDCIGALPIGNDLGRLGGSHIRTILP